MKNLISLAERQSELTRALILNAAVETLESSSIRECTARSAARKANISERTVFRHFPSREAFLDAVAAEVAERLELPEPPQNLAELGTAADALYRAFEARQNLIVAALHTELFHRIRQTKAQERWLAICKIIEKAAPWKSAHDKRMAAANIRYYLSASTWHYYRFYFGFDIDDSIACARTAIRDALRGLDIGAA